MNENPTEREEAHIGGFLHREHNKLRFTELGETFLARLILAKCPVPASTDLVCIEVALSDFFRSESAGDLERILEGVEFQVSHKTMEVAADFLSALAGVDLQPASTTIPALDYYNNHIESRLRWLKSGCETDGKLPCIEDFDKRMINGSVVFAISARPAELLLRVSEYVTSDFELPERVLAQLMMGNRAPANPGARIDYRKQVELLVQGLDKRQQLTSEVTFSFLSNEFPFRWVVQALPIGGGVTLPGIGTSQAEDKAVLPLFLEINGFFDILSIALESNVLNPFDVVVRYFIQKPAKRNLFGSSNQGLEPTTRARLNEAELSLYVRIHEHLRDQLAFGGRPNFELSFGALCSWLLRKAAYCLEEPTYLRDPAREWLRHHAGDSRVRMEDLFFLPRMYAALRDEFGSRVVKKPERFGGEIDILFDDQIAIELKVRRDEIEPLVVEELIVDNYRPASQAAAYAAVSRVAFVLVLDLPSTDAAVINLEACARVIVRDNSGGSDYPTCIVVIVFRGHHPRPSSIR